MNNKNTHNKTQILVDISVWLVRRFGVFMYLLETGGESFDLVLVFLFTLVGLATSSSSSSS